MSKIMMTTLRICYPKKINIKTFQNQLQKTLRLTTFYLANK